jgi:hypothetical protein
MNHPKASQVITTDPSSRGYESVRMRPYDWYIRARERIEQFLPGLDKDLQVDVDTTLVTPNDGSAEYTIFALTFSHPSNPNLQWTMEIQMNEEYIEHELEQIVTQIYFQRVE